MNADLNTIIDLLNDLPRHCRYHGTDFARTGFLFGFPRCDSCKQPYRVHRALLAASRLCGEEASRKALADALGATS